MATEAPKKRLTLKTVKAKTPDEGEAQGLPEPVGQVEFQPEGSTFKVTGVLAIIAAVLFCVLIAIQALELSFYKAPPNVWPPKIAVAAPAARRPARPAKSKPDTEKVEEEEDETSEEPEADASGGADDEADS
jgi:hypothetical protein